MKQLFLPSSFCSPPSSGFTLLELVIVTVIIGILLSLTMPRFHLTAQRLRIEGTAFEFTQLLRAAHARAITLGQPVIWAWDPLGRRAQLYDVPLSDDAHPMSQRVTERFADTAPLVDDVTITPTRAEQFLRCELLGDPTDCTECSCIHFGPDGTAEDGTAEPIVVRVVCPGRAYTITIDAPTSQITLTQGSAAP